MKKYHIIKLLSCFLACFSLTTNATELDSTALEELKEIVRNSFQHALYQESEELNQCNNQGFSDFYNGAQPSTIFDRLPIELLLKISMEIDDAKPLCQGMGLTCHLFYLISKHPVFILTPYCLTETRPHSIPRNIFRTKVCNTKDGLFKLAALYSVSGDDLLEWFGNSLLESFLKKENIPQILANLKQENKALENMQEDELDKLYPIFKVAIAMGQQTDEIFQWLDVFINVSNATLSQRRLCSLHQAHRSGYSYILRHLLYRLLGVTNLLVHPDHYPVSVVARDLLLTGDNFDIIDVNHCYYVNNPQKKEFSIQLIKWCAKTGTEFQPCFIQDALSLGQSELAFLAQQKIMPRTDQELTNYDQYKISSILSSFIQHKEQVESNIEYVELQIKKFAAKLYSQYWRNLSLNNKAQALILMFRIGVLKEFGKEHFDYNQILRHIKNKGLYLESLEELKDHDPFKMIEILSK